MGVWAQVIPGSQVVDGAIFTVDVGFQALAVGIDNYTPYYLYLKDADAWIAPYWVGAIRTLSHATDYGYVAVQSPFGSQGTPSGVNAFIHLTWTDSPLVQQTPGSSVATSGSSATVNVTSNEIVREFLQQVILISGLPVALPLVLLTSRVAINVQASPNNTGTIYLGSITVTPDETSTGGTQLYPGANGPIDVSTAILYAAADVANQKLILLEGA